MGPGDEQVDLVFVRAAKGTGLQLVHPTWAGAFVLAAMVFLFPATHFVLLDSDCIPVSLFEIDKLWMLLCLGTAEFTWAEGSSYSSGVGITWVTQSGPELSAVIKECVYEQPNR